tara:strand:- start:66 stop:560 length:495 start_codon:yes stop_codon:yes gene_type:complete
MSDVQITLTHDEALVLFDLLTRYSQTDVLGTRDQSEQRALWNLQCVLEKILPEVLDPDYRALLATAQGQLRDSDGTNAQYEEENGRVAFWLEPSHLEFIANEWRKMPTDAPEADRKQWADIAFRSIAALHKAGVEYNPQFPAVGYKIVPRNSNDAGDDKIERTS